MRASVLTDVGPNRKQPGRRDPLDRVGRLDNQRSRFSPPRLLRYGRIDDQLGKTTGRAEPHLKRVYRVGPRVLA